MDSAAETPDRAPVARSETAAIHAAQARVNLLFRSLATFLVGERLHDWLPELGAPERVPGESYYLSRIRTPHPDPDVLCARLLVFRDSSVGLWLYGEGYVPLRDREGRSLPSCAALRVYFRTCREEPSPLKLLLAQFEFQVRSLYEFGRMEPPHVLDLENGRALRADLQEALRRFDRGGLKKAAHRILVDYPGAF